MVEHRFCIGSLWERDPGEKNSYQWVAGSSPAEGVYQKLRVPKHISINQTTDLAKINSLKYFVIKRTTEQASKYQNKAFK